MLTRKPPPATRATLYASLCCIGGLLLVAAAVVYTRMQSGKPDLLAETRRALNRGSWKDAIDGIRIRERADPFDPGAPASRLLLVQTARRTNDQAACRQVAQELIDRYGYSGAALAAKRILNEIDGTKVATAQWQRTYYSYLATLSAAPKDSGQKQLENLFKSVRQDFLEDTKIGCGTCRLETKWSHENCILLASVHAQRSSDFTDWAWRSLATDGFPDVNTILFTLIRQYETAGQRADFARLWDELESRAKRRADSAASDQSGNQIARTTVISPRSQIVQESLALLSGDCNAWLATFKRAKKEDSRYLWSASLPRNVAAWLLMRDYPVTTDKIIAAAKSGEYHVHRLAELLVLINSPAAIDGLRKLIELPDEKDRAAVRKVILTRMSGPDDLILEAVVQGKSMEAIAAEPADLHEEFLRFWPQAGRNSMPKELPWDLFKREET